MKFCVSIGTFELLSFVELNIIQCRKVFGPDVPILLSDGKSVNSDKMCELAERYDAFYVGESENRGHFCGCQQTTINSLVFGQQMNADVTLKCNQRFILLRPELVGILEMVFGNPEIQLALPGRPDPAGITGSKFYASFPYLVDCVAWRTGAIDPEFAKSSYESSWKNGTHPHAAYTETWYSNLIKERFTKQHAILNCLTNNYKNQPKFFLRKIQSSRQEYVDLAVENKMESFEFPVCEWAALKGSSYKPRPAA